MIPKELTKSDLISILEAIEATHECGNTASFERSLLHVKELLEADYCICGVGSVKGGNIGEVLAVVNGNYPEEWLRIYREEELYRKDPVVRHLVRFSTTQFWSDSFKLFSDEEARQLRSISGEFGLKYGISSAVYTPGADNISIFSFAGTSDRFKTNHKRILDIMSLHLHKALIRTCGIGAPYNPEDFSEMAL